MKHWAVSEVQFNRWILQAFRHSCTHSYNHTRVAEKWLSLSSVPAVEGKPTIANYLSLNTIAALAVWMPKHVPMRALRVYGYASVTVGEQGEIASCRIQHTEKKIVEELEEKVERGETCREGIKGNKAVIDDYILHL